jgi:hypothetical protein
MSEKCNPEQCAHVRRAIEQGIREGESKQAIAEIHAQERFLERVRREEFEPLKAENASLRSQLEEKDKALAQAQGVMDKVLYEAASVIYLADRSDYLPILWTIVRKLSPEVAQQLEAGTWWPFPEDHVIYHSESCPAREGEGR